jgi:hypothetical protein
MWTILLDGHTLLKSTDHPAGSHPLHELGDVQCLMIPGRQSHLWPDISIPSRCNVIDVIYSGDFGGIVCCLDIGGPDTKSAHLVSITHLIFNRNVPLAREIEAYQRHRIKKLKQQRGSGYN